MSPPSTYRDWKYQIKARLHEGRAIKYSIAFYRERGDWYDEIRLDSHERNRGKEVVAPHFHAKLISGFKKDVNSAVEEIMGIITIIT